MALFKRKQTKAEVSTPSAKDVGEKKDSLSPTVNISLGSDLSRVLKSPRITEKATMHQEAGVYTFDVAENATKRSVMQAVTSFYNVTPRKVRVVTIPSKQKRNTRTGKRGVKQGGKKAYVYLKEGESITIA